MFNEPKSSTSQSIQFSAQPAVASSTMPVADTVTGQLDSLLGDRYSLVFVGYSGLGYADSAGMLEKAETCIREALTKHSDGINVVIGATEDGIGEIYGLVQGKAELKEKVTLLGIVSVAAQDWGVAIEEENVVFVEDPGNTWQVKNAEGYSYTLYPAQKNGELLAMGGGAVALEELDQARERGVEVNIFDFAADPQRLQAKLKPEQSSTELMPVRGQYFPE
ncbi:hypothetical protein [Pseudomonas rubra]|uniref:Uncharacterized protein n=1 Tax=Pseudomonas rubra TaxID=2942627 RepID=A0ABT5P7K3_9PSED|nr:hypothetical protein [Pseudomonas rubra]MDD1014279.1 hypothetical protein [Pseudomonas rubra]MDD1037606.1 hypothetical protein [Pseudomonas rubra]MDD1155702.1 hypothetical protein [Pseudomonas rubra]